MKPLSCLLFAAFFAVSGWPTAAQLPSPPSREVTPTGNNSDVVPDGITFYRGQTYLLRNGRAALVDANLVPPDKVLTRRGGLVPVPPELLGTLPPRDKITPSLRSDVMQNGIVHWRGVSYLIRDGVMVKIDSTWVPEGRVYTASGTLAALPSDFSGFVHDPNHVGTGGSAVASEGTQALPAQAGVPQLSSGPQEPRITLPQPNVAGPGSSGFVRTGVITNPNGTTTPIGVTPNGAAVALDGTGAVINATNTGTTPVAGSAGASATTSNPNATTSGSANASVPTGNLGASVGTQYVPGTVTPAAPQAVGVGATLSGSAGTANTNARMGARQTTGTGANGTTSGVNGAATTSGTAAAGTSTGTATGGAALTGTTGTAAQTGSGAANPTATQTGTVTSQSTPPATPTGTVSTQGTPVATPTGTVSTQSTPPATPTGSVSTQSTLPSGQNTTNPNSVPGNTGVSGGTTSAATGTTGTPGTATGTSTAGGGSGTSTSTGTSGGTSTGGGASGGSSGGATSGGSSGGGTSGGASGGGGTSGGAGAGGGGGS